MGWARFVSGLACGGYWCVAFVIVQEVISAPNRLFASCISAAILPGDDTLASGEDAAFEMGGP